MGIYGPPAVGVSFFRRECEHGESCHVCGDWKKYFKPPVVFWRGNGRAITRENYAEEGNCIEELADDFVSTTGRFTCAAASGEGGGFFRRGNLSYLMTGYGCCFCPAGGNAQVWLSRDGVLGNYSYLADINPPTNPNTNKATPAPSPLLPPPPLSAVCDMRGVWASWSGGSWGNGNGGRSGTGAAAAEANTTGLVSRPSESSSPKFSKTLF